MTREEELERYFEAIGVALEESGGARLPAHLSQRVGATRHQLVDDWTKRFDVVLPFSSPPRMPKTGRWNGPSR